MDKPHGQHTIFIEENRIIASCEGNWNLEEAELFIQEFIKTAQTFSGKPWIRINNLANFEFSTPECLQPLGKLIDWCENNNCIASLYVLGLNEQKFFVDMVKQASHASKIYYEFFNSLDAALKWCAINHPAPSS